MYRCVTTCVIAYVKNMKSINNRRAENAIISTVYVTLRNSILVLWRYVLTTCSYLLPWCSCCGLSAVASGAWSIPCHDPCFVGKSTSPMCVTRSWSAISGRPPRRWPLTVLRTRHWDLTSACAKDAGKDVWRIVCSKGIWRQLHYLWLNMYLIHYAVMCHSRGVHDVTRGKIDIIDRIIPNLALPDVVSCPERDFFPCRMFQSRSSCRELDWENPFVE